MGKNISKSSLARANQDRDYRIFEEFAFYLVGEARKRCYNDSFELGAMSMLSTPQPLTFVYRSSGGWEFRKKKGGLKVHTLYDVETLIPIFFHITTASTHDSKVMKEIPYETGSYYIFDRAYNKF